MEEPDVIVRTAAAVVFLAAVLYGAASDLRRYRIPNWAPITAAAAFIPYAAAGGIDAGMLAVHLAIGLGVLAGGFVLFAFGIAGGGDAKLLAAGALWAGAHDQLFFLFVVSIAGGILALAMLLFRRFPVPARFHATAWVKRLHSGEQGIPYGIAIAAGAVALLLRIYGPASVPA